MAEAAEQPPAGDAPPEERYYDLAEFAPCVESVLLCAMSCASVRNVYPPNAV